MPRVTRVCGVRTSYSCPEYRDCSIFLWATYAVGLCITFNDSPVVTIILNAMVDLATTTCVEKLIPKKSKSKCGPPETHPFEFGVTIGKRHHLGRQRSPRPLQLDNPHFRLAKGSLHLVRLLFGVVLSVLSCSVLPLTPRCAPSFLQLFLQPFHLRHPPNWREMKLQYNSRFFVV